MDKWIKELATLITLPTLTCIHMHMYTTTYSNMDDAHGHFREALSII